MDDSKAHLEVNKLFKTVVEGGYCIGCGACASVSNSPIKMKLDEYGRFTTDLNLVESLSTTYSSLLAVCPFSDKSLNEDQINKEIFSKNCGYHNKLGYYLATYAGYVTDSNFRENG